MGDKQGRSEPLGEQSAPPSAQSILEGRLGGCSWHVVADVEDFRSLVGQIVQATDRVVELGASSGETTVILAGSAAQVVAIEKSAERVERLRKLARGQDNIEVVHADAGEVGSITSGLPRPADVLFVDVGGDAPAWRAVALCFEYVRALRPRCVALRNREFHEFLRSIRAGGTAEEGGIVFPDPDAPAPAADPALRRHSARRLARALQTAGSPRAVELLIEALRDGNYSTRKTVSEALAAVGEPAREPLVELLADESAPIRARRISASLLQRCTGREGIASLPELMRHPSVAVQWAATGALLDIHERLGSAYEPTGPIPPGAAVACAESRGEPLPVDQVLSLIDSEEDFSVWLARGHLRRTAPASTRLLQESLATGDVPADQVVTAIGALGLLDPAAARLLPEKVMEVAADEQRASALWRLASSCFGLADQRLAGDLLAATDDVWARSDLPRLVRRAGDETPVGALVWLWGRKPGTWNRGDALEVHGKLAALGLELSLAAVAGMKSPHPELREGCRRVSAWLAKSSGCRGRGTVNGPS